MSSIKMRLKNSLSFSEFFEAHFNDLSVCLSVCLAVCLSVSFTFFSAML